MAERSFATGELSSGLKTISDRVTALVHEAVENHELPRERADTLLTEFSTGMEEFRVAEEELVVQGEQLAASQRTIDAERERFAELFEFAPDGYVETDEMGKILEANTAAARLLHVPGRFLPGKLIHSFTSTEDRRSIRQALTELANGVPVQEVLVHLAPRNSPGVWAEIRMGGHYDPLTETFRVRWLIRDVSERMKLERELSQLHVSVDLLSALADVNRLVEGEEDALTSVLSRLVDLAHRMVETDAGVMVTDGKSVVVRAAAGSSTAEMCDLQINSDGPAMLTLADGIARVLRADELDQWPTLAEAARQHGIRMLVCHPIEQDGAVIGTFNLYVKGEVVEPEQVARMFAENATASIANAQVYASARRLADGLATALESRGVIEQAKGILIAMQGCSPDQAFGILRAASQRQNRKLRVIAEEIVTRAMNRPPPSPRAPATGVTFGSGASPDVQGW